MAYIPFAIAVMRTQGSPPVRNNKPCPMAPSLSHSDQGSGHLQWGSQSLLPDNDSCWRPHRLPEPHHGLPLLLKLFAPKDLDQEDLRRRQGAFLFTHFQGHMLVGLNPKDVCIGSLSLATILCTLNGEEAPLIRLGPAQKQAVGQHVRDNIWAKINACIYTKIPMLQRHKVAEGHHPCLPDHDGLRHSHPVPNLFPESLAAWA